MIIKMIRDKKSPAKKEKFHLKTSILIVSFLAYSVFTSYSQVNQISVVPYPQKVLIQKGEFKALKREIGLKTYGISSNTESKIIDQLKEEFSLQYMAKLKLVSDRQAAQILIGLPESDAGFMQICYKNNLVPDSQLGEEGYLLKISEKEILIIANTEAGVFYGVQTLKQMIRGDIAKNGIPNVLVKDWPSIEIRCIMDDISRGPVPDNAFIKEQIRRYSEMKINHMSFYIEHVVKTKKYPDFAPSNGAISIEEFSELSEFAKDYHIKLIGNFQSLGHFEKILSHPQYRHLGATESMLDPLNPDALIFLEDVYTEMAPAFSSDLFNPNLDEAWDLSRGKLAGAGDSLSVAQIYANHINSIHAILSKLGKKTMIWGDIILQYPEIFDMISKDIVIGAWEYGSLESFSDYIDPIKSAGFNFTVSPGVLNSSRIIPDFNMTIANIRTFVNEGYEKGTLGVYSTIWDDGGMHAFSRDWYGVAYTAEQCWRPNFDEIEDFDNRLSLGVYGDENNALPRSLHELNKLTDLAPTFEMNMNVFWKALIPERGSKVTFNLNDWGEVKEIAHKSYAILAESESTHYADDNDFVKFSIDQYIFLAESREQLIAAAGLYNLASELQLQDRTQSIEYLNNASMELQKLKIKFDYLSEEFVRLWNLENRPYWLDRGLIAYENRQNAIENQLILLTNSISAFEKGSSLPPPADLRLDIRNQSGHFFQYFLLCGSFPIVQFEESAVDFLANIGGEANVKPFPGMKFIAENGEEFSWNKYDSPKLGEVDFKTIFEPHITAVAYAYCIINSPDKRKVTGLLGSNDGATVYCNGERVFYHHGKRNLIPDENAFAINLEEGANHILIKVEQWKAGWGFSFRLKEQEIRSHKQKYYIIK